MDYSMESESNQLITDYWAAFCKANNLPTDTTHTAEQFGHQGIADELAQLIIDGKKTATCSAHKLYEVEGDNVPEAGLYTIVLNSQEHPVCIIKTTEVTLTSMNETPEALALAEGEGSYDDWYDSHLRYFTAEFREYGRKFVETEILVFERFELLDIKKD